MRCRASDIWACGVVLYLMLTCRLPFEVSFPPMRNSLPMLCSHGIQLQGAPCSCEPEAYSTGRRATYIVFGLNLAKT